MRHEAEVGGHFARALRNAAQDGEEEVVELARVGLAAYGQHALEAHVVGDVLLKGPDLAGVAAEEGEEARARAGRALAAVEGYALELEIQPLKVEAEVLRPHGRALADGRGLRRLIVRVGEDGRVRVLLDEVRERGEGVHEQHPYLL